MADIAGELLGRLEKLKQMTDIQCSSGNWDYSPYMQGMANGMLFAVACMEGRTPDYLQSPERWLADIPTPGSAPEPPKPLTKAGLLAYFEQFLNGKTGTASAEVLADVCLLVESETVRRLSSSPAAPPPQE